ncbi:hypothetical protein ACFL6G_03865 [candidate division KSB1 bacterium]
MEPASKKAVKEEIVENLYAGNIDRAKDIEHQNDIMIIEAKRNAEEVVQNMIKKVKDLNIAIEICEQYDLEAELRIMAISLQLRNYIKEKEYDKGIEWAKKYSLPSNEVNTIAIKAFNDCLSQRNVKKALDYKHKYQLPDNLIFEKVVNKFNVLFDRKDYESAMLLGQDFEISRKRTLIASIRAYHQFISNDNVAKLISFEKKFNILGDREIHLVEEKDLKLLGDIFRDMIVVSLLSKGNPGMLAQIVNKLDLFEKRELNPVAREIVKHVLNEVIVLHNKFIDSGLYSEALKVVENFGLMSVDLSPDNKVKLIEAAEKAHNKLLRENNLNLARTLKENYNLFNKNIIGDSIEKVNKAVDEYIIEMLGKGDSATIVTVVEEYDVSNKRIIELANVVLVDLMRSRKFVEAFNIVSNLKVNITDSNLGTQVKKNFEEAFKDGQMELAANIGYYFKLRNTKVKKAAFRIWQKNLESGKFDLALELKKKHKLPKSMIEPVVKEVYRDLIDHNNTEEASRIRQMYRINLSIMGLFKEVLIKLFSK